MQFSELVSHSRIFAVYSVLAVFLSACDSGTTNVVSNIADGNTAELQNTFDTTIQAPIELPVTPTRSIMAVGDSITQGANLQRSYRYHLIQKLELAGCEHTRVGSQTGTELETDFNSPHESYSTMKADHFLTGYTTWSGENEGIEITMDRYFPDVVLMHIGSNDLYYEESIESVIDDIRQIVSIITTTNPDAVVLLSNLIPWYGVSDSGAEILFESEQLGIAIEDLIAELNDPSVHFVDVFSGYTRSMMLVDLIHPNNLGELHLTDRFFNAYVNAGLC